MEEKIVPSKRACEMLHEANMFWHQMGAKNRDAAQSHGEFISALSVELERLAVEAHAASVISQDRLMDISSLLGVSFQDLLSRSEKLVEELIASTVVDSVDQQNTKVVTIDVEAGTCLRVNLLNLQPDKGGDRT